MGKIVFWLVVFFVALLGLRLWNAAQARKRRGGDARRAPPAGAGAMTRCVNCGVYVPATDALPGPRGPLCGDPACRPAGSAR